ncbi:MAG: carbohydrate binding domain-containing protein, partial [Gaiellaceae bacterium]
MTVETTGAPASPRVWRPWRHERVRSASALVLPGTLLGLGALAVARGGTGERPVLAVALLLTGAAAAAVPLRYGLPVAIVLGAFGGFMLDFAGGVAPYWNEVFTIVLVARSLVVRRPSRREFAIGAGVLLVFGAYLLTGTSASAVGWGAKVLLSSVFAGWAVFRLRPGPDEWRALYRGLVAAAVAGLVLAIWQRSLGVSGLLELGLPYGERVREVEEGGTVRAFGGSTSPAPFSYLLAIAVCAWTGLALAGGRDRRLAIATLWLLPVAGTGIVLSVDRTAAIGLVFGLVAIAVALRRRIALPLVAVTAVLAAATAAGVAWGGLGGDVVPAAKARMVLWQEYLADFRPLGAGPATAGSAYDEVDPETWVPPVRVPNSWRVGYDRISITRRGLAVAGGLERPRPPLRLRATATSALVPRRLTVRLGEPSDSGSRRLLSRTVPTGAAVPVGLRIPRGSGEVPLSFTVEPVVNRPRGPTAAPYARGRLVNLASNPSFERGLRGWRAYQGTGQGTVISVASGGARYGRAALRVAKARPTTDPQGAWYRFFPIVRGQPYAVSMYLRGQTGTESVSITVTEWSRPSSFKIGPPIVLSTSWRRHTLTFTARRTINAAIYIRRAHDSADRPETFFVDGVQIEEGPAATEYCDGSLDGCRWEGARHRSWSSRGSSTRLVSPVLTTPRPGTLETIRVRSAMPPLPQSPPFAVALDAEKLKVVEIVDRTTLRVRRGANRTRPSRHRAGTPVEARVKAVARRRGAEPAGGPLSRLGFAGWRPQRPSVRALTADETSASLVLALQDLRVAGRPAPTTRAEHVWERWFDRTPAALEGDGPGLVDNLYV